MGCCAVKDDIKATYQKNLRKTFEKDKKISQVSLSVTQQQTNQQQDEEFIEYINSLRVYYGFKRHKTLWFNSNQQIRLNYPYYLQTQCYHIYCEIVKMNFQKGPYLKFALIIPEQFYSNDDEVNKNRIFVYCKQKYPFEDSDQIPVIIQIKQKEKDQRKGVYNFIANLNNLITMNMSLTIKQQQQN